eukprot:TRINITY_DN9160_c0_g3_i1.p1 TRINITY_DN9160_c0_g3~~TRINITY_DN9160_c0_g3_i1.p1  ORF type:complete len:296 (-),score=54.47 TRINITY_DN9160_c0_g3_i1:1046-1933(-)
MTHPTPVAVSPLPCSGAGGTGCSVHPKMQSCNPWMSTKLSIFMAASGVSDRGSADQQFVDRLLDLQGAAPVFGRLCLLAFCPDYNDEGALDMAATGLHTPNDYILQLHADNPERTWPVGSVHPYMPDAAQELERLADQGVRMIKWLPNSMNINLRDPRCRPVFKVMRQRGMVLLCHTGDENSVDAGGVTNQYGNPLLLRSALDAGVTVIAAHCGTEGSNLDLDSDDTNSPKVDNFDLFIRLMAEPKYDGLLYGDISAIICFRRVGRYTMELLEHKEIHHRLVSRFSPPGNSRGFN